MIDFRDPAASVDIRHISNSLPPAGQGAVLFCSNGFDSSRPSKLPFGSLLDHFRPCKAPAPTVAVAGSLLSGRSHSRWPVDSGMGPQLGSPLDDGLTTRMAAWFPSACLRGLGQFLAALHHSQKQ